MWFAPRARARRKARRPRRHSRAARARLRNRGRAGRQRKSWASSAPTGRVAGRRPGRVLLPFLQAVPDIEAGGKRRQLQVGIALLEGGEHGLGPWPAGAAEELAELGGLAAPREARVGETGEQRLGHGGKVRHSSASGAMARARARPSGSGTAGTAGATKAKSSAMSRWRWSRAARIAERGAAAHGPGARPDRRHGTRHGARRQAGRGRLPHHGCGAARPGPHGNAGAGGHCNGKRQGGRRCGGEGHWLQLPPKAAEGQAQVLHARESGEVPRRSISIALPQAARQLFGPAAKLAAPDDLLESSDAPLERCSRRNF